MYANPAQRQDRSKRKTLRKGLRWPRPQKCGNWRARVQQYLYKTARFNPYRFESPLQLEAIFTGLKSGIDQF